MLCTLRLQAVSLDLVKLLMSRTRGFQIRCTDNTRVIWKVRIMASYIDKMLSNNTFLETKNQRVLDGLFFFRKGLGVHALQMLKLS